MDTLQRTVDHLKTVTNQQADQFEDADIVLIATDLARTQTLYEMALRSASKLLSLSLLDFI